MAALTRLAKPSAISHHSRRFYCNISSSSPVSHSASSYNPHLTKPTRSVNDSTNRSIQWVFLGSPDVGKGTYAIRLSNLLGMPHIATGDLVREELAASGPLSHHELCGERLSFLDHYSKFINCDKSLPSWSDADVEAFIATEPVHGPALRTAMEAAKYASYGSAIGAVSTAGFAWKYSRSLHEIYQQKLQTCVADGELTDDDVAALLRLRVLLCIPHETIEAAQLEIFGSLFEKVVKDAIAGVDGYDADVKLAVRKAAHGFRLSREAA